MKKKIVIPMMGVVLIGSLFLTHSQTIYANSFGGGDGTLSNPYLISTAEHLEELRQSVAAGNTYSAHYFKQVASIDFKHYDNDDDPTNGNWEPIGNSATPFQGSYDGGYHTIKNVKIFSDDDYVGFFGYTQYGSVIKKLSLENLKIKGAAKKAIGGLVAYGGGVELSEVRVTGEITHRGSQIPIGGVLGHGYYNLSMDSIIFSGTITATEGYLGGIIGRIEGSVDRMSNFLATAHFNATSGYAGGIVGVSHSYLNPKNFLSVSTFKGTSCGGIQGRIASNNSSVKFYNAYWEKEISGISKTAGSTFTSSQLTGATGLTMDKLQGEEAKTNLVGFDFDNVWETTNELPQMRWEKNIKPATPSGSSEILISGKVEPTLVSLTIPSDPVTFVINPNLEDDQIFISPTFEVINETKIPLNISIYSFERVDGPFNDVLPTAHEDWSQLENDDCYDFALGVEPKASDGWQSLTEGVRYVADKSNYELGVLAPKGRAALELVAKHGFLFPTAFEATYSLILVAEF